MAEWFGAACVIVGCFWVGVAIGAGVALMLGFLGGFTLSGWMGRRNALVLINRMIRDETASVAERARRADVEAAVAEARHIGEAADLVLQAMTEGARVTR